MKRMMIMATCLILLVPAMSGCTNKRAIATIAEASIGKEVTLDLIDTKGAKMGTAHLTQLAQGVRIDVEATHLAPGKHGIHFHETGKCDPPGFTTSGSH